ncbi:hypothetical protein [Flavobacterium sp.]|uniref:hypothetical protein n=1 Tax=Flavobacterium sp. TaxID=239 RepID=UPI0026064F15|nr:hypothetical protein [Flavobacterium sp.]MDG2431983.1 hypothetical protein [Flavobacterium sp.]
MKFFALFICFYLTTLTALPTVRVIKMHFAEKCQSSCGKSNSKKDTSDGGCQKEKCILNLTFNSATFVVFNQNYNFKYSFIPFEKLEKSVYHKNLFPNYNVTIWQPPEAIFSIS